MSQMDHRVCKLTWFIQAITVFPFLSWTSSSYSCKPSSQASSLYCCQFLADVMRWGRRSVLVFQVSHHCAGVSAALHHSHWTYRSTMLCDERPDHMCFFRLSVPSLLSFSVCFSGCHIMSVSQAGRVTTCRLGSDPVSAERRVTSAERSELRFQETAPAFILARTHK